MILHPRFRTLARFADGEPDERHRARVAAHLARCPRCRSTVASLREATVRAREATVPAPPADALERILARRAAGERVILPTTPPAPRRRPRRLLPAAAACALLLAAVATALLRTPDLQADGSELALLPEKPRAGATIHVEYRATAALAGEERLVLRARYRTAGEQRQNFQLPHLRVAELVRVDDRTYRGSFHLPDSAVYGVFAVEDPRGSRVDAGGEAWDVLVHGADGHPEMAALEQQGADASERNLRLMDEAVRELAVLYPERSWNRVRLLWAETRGASRAAADSVRRTHWPRMLKVHDRLGRDPDPSPDEIDGLIRYAEELDDARVAEVWRERLYRDHPTHSSTIQRRMLDARRAYGSDLPRLVEEHEKLWTLGGPATPHLAYAGYNVAQRTGDAGLTLRWAERVERHLPRMHLLVALTLHRTPATREEGMDLLRAEVRRLQEHRDEERMLTQTVADKRAENRLVASNFLGQLGEALIASGRAAAGLDTLDRAVEGTWDAGLFRTIAATRLALGDTAGAAPLVARIAIDPSTSAAYADSARAMLGRHFDAGTWHAHTDSARRDLRDAILEQTVNRGLRGRVRLVDADGRATTLEPASETATLVAFWSRHCPPSVEQLARFQAAAERLRARGVRVVAVTDEEPSDEARRFLAEKKLTFPAYYDVDREARRAFENQTTPRYFVLDPDGRIRFGTYAPEDAERAAVVLGERARSR